MLKEIAAEHFQQLNHGKMKSLSKEMIKEIIKNESLILNDENVLIYFVNELYPIDYNYSNLFKFVAFSKKLHFLHSLQRLILS